MPSRILLEAAKKGIHLHLRDGALAFKGPQGAMTPALKQAIGANKQAIIDLLIAHQQGGSETARIARGAAPAQARVLSFAQQRLWLLDRIDPGSAHYNIAGALSLVGTLDHAALEYAFSAIVERHATLRTCFIEGADGQPQLVMSAPRPFGVQVDDLSALPAPERALEAERRAAAEADAPFDLARDLMLRARLLKLDADDHVLLVTMHHIASDGWSMALLINEFGAFYRARVLAEPSTLAPLAIDYADYAQWQRTWLQGEVIERQLGYWAGQLAGLPAAHGLPLDHARPKLQTYGGATHTTLMDAGSVRALQALCQAGGATLFMGLHAAFAALLARYSNETDIVIGSPVANRGQAEVAHLIGFFVNTLVLRSDVAQELSFTGLLAQSKRMLLDAYAHQQVPFEQVVERVQPQRSLGHSPLFQVMLALQNNEEGALELPGLILNAVERAGTVAKYDLTLNAHQGKDGLRLDWEYNSALFAPASIVRMAAHFDTLLASLLGAPEHPIWRADMLGAAERQQLLEGWNDTAAAYPDGHCIHELFEERAAAAPDSVAIVFGEREVRYGELNAMANRLAHMLIADRHVRPDTLVGICVERSIEMVVGILAILKAGGAYVPLDPEYPEARLAYMLQDAGLDTVLTQRHLRAGTPMDGCGALCLDDDDILRALALQPAHNPDARAQGLRSNHLAYVVYTSGSSGNPKGVLVEHGSVVRLVRNTNYIALGEASVVAQASNMSFDAITFELWGSLLNGARLVCLPKQVLIDTAGLREAIVRHRITDLFITTALFNAIASDCPDALASLDTLMFGGEDCSLQAIRSIAANGMPRRLLHVYGPTENTTFSLWKELTPGYLAQTAKVALGTALSNTTAYVLDAHGAPAPVGVAGELHLGGAGLARGYLNRPELTAEKFIAHPFGGSGERLYKSGDLVRRLADGDLEFLGRMDDQVKLRGFRIELGEIEHALGAVDGVKESVVAVREFAGERHIVAYVVPEHEGEGMAERLRAHLDRTLPHYMLPTAFVLLDSLPLTPNGKVDRKALPVPDMAQMQAQYVAPRTEQEQVLCRIVEGVLGIERVGMSDNFFQLGGHSLSATRLVARINQAFQLTLPLKAVFGAQTLADLTHGLKELGQETARKPLVPVARDGDLVPSYAQQRLWMLDQIEGGSAHYNLPGALRLAGRLDIAALERAFGTIVERHESLRTSFAAGADGQPLQRIAAIAAFAVALSDLSDQDGREALLARHAADEAAKPFDLARDLMLRAHLLKLASDDHVLLVTMHHIASDGWSMAILVDEFCALYRAFVQGEASPLAPLAIQYADYAHWQRNWLQGEVLEQQLGYWTGQLAGLPAVHGLPLDRKRPALQTHDGALHLSHVDAGVGAALRSLCKAGGATLFMGLHAAFAVLLARYSNETDIVVGSPIANREQAEVAGLIGFFVNTLVLRSDLSERPSFTALLAQSRRTLLDAYAHQQVPFEQLVERLQPQRSLSHSPLFQVMLVLQNNEQSQFALPGLTLSAVDDSRASAKFELTLNVADNGAGLELGWVYNTALFDAGTIARMAQHFTALLGALTASPELDVFAADMLGEADRRQLIAGWNDTATAFPHDACIHELFERQAAAQPDAVALEFEGEQLSYAQLDARAGRLANYLSRERGVGPDTLVGICIERSLDMVVAILAILKAGGAYVPLDPEYPAARLAYMLADARLDTVLTHRHLLASTPVAPEQALCLDDAALQAQLAALPALAPRAPGLTAASLAYVIYTSGSTGNPKGVMVEHRALVNRIDWMEREYGSTPADRILQKTPFSFDVSVWEFVWPLSVGARIVLARPEGHKDPAYLSALIVERQVTKLHFVPSMLGIMLALGDLGQCTSLRQVFCSGEALSLEHVAQFQARCPWAGLHNLYGPTEAAIDVSYWDCAQVDAGLGSVPIGRPIQNIQLYVLNGQPAPQGVAGELHIGGVGLARGYLNRPDLTAEKFIPNPFFDPLDPASSERLYRTGDLARWLPDGNLEYLGRIDHQVKIRGFRIELGEIENALCAHPQVTDAVVLARGTGADQRLVAYVVADAADMQRELIEALRTDLARTLPDYMVPAAFVVLDRMPVTPNGKADRKALPEPDALHAQAVYVAPQSATEMLLCDIWQAILKLDRVGVADNFFQLGGHSLLVLQVIARLQRGGIAMPVRQLFATPVLGDLAAALDNADAAAAPFAAPANGIAEGCTHITPAMLALIDLSDDDIARIVAQVPGGAGNVQDIYPLAPLQEGILFHHMMSKHSDPYVTPLLFAIPGRAALDNFVQALECVVARHDVLRTAFLWHELPAPVQVVVREASLPLSWLALDPAQDALAQMQALCAPDRQWIDLGQAPLVRLRVACEPASERHFVLLQVHHLIEDATSLQILQGEIAHYMGGGAALPAAAPYREFVAHALYQMAGNDADSFFTRLLGDVEETTAPFGLADVQGDGSGIAEQSEAVPGQVAERVREQARAAQVSPATLFHAAWAMVVAAGSGRDDVVFGTVLSGRLQGIDGAGSMLGMFINTLPLRVRAGAATAATLVRQVHAGLMELLPYEQASLALAQRCSGLPGGAPLFTSMLNYRHGEPGEQAEADVGFAYLGGQERTNFPLSMSVDDNGHGFILTAKVDAAAGAARVLACMQAALAALTDALASAPATPVAALPALPAQEWRQMLADCNGTARDYPRQTCLHHLFEQHAAVRPAALALVYQDQELSYGALNARANQLARYLVAQRQVGPDTLVGICCERAPEMVVAILAVLKAGAAYVPLDPAYPAARLDYMLGDAALSTVLTQQAVCARVDLGTRAVCLDDPALSQALAQQRPSNPDGAALGLTARHLAYVIYTSGSTGEPKGVMVEHHSLINLAQNIAQMELAAEGEQWGWVASYAFDGSVKGLTQLMLGRALHIVPETCKRDPALLAPLLARLAVIDCTPLMVEAWFEAGLGAQLPNLIIGGEAIGARLWQQLVEWQQTYARKAVNVYGPTECTVDSHACLVAGELPNIGRLLPNVQAYVFSGAAGLAARGVAGELHLGGVGLARGYLNRPELTTEKFIDHPLRAGERLYRTGDLVRWLADGSMEYLGRIDHQVKIRGFRIELGEVESALAALAAVKEAVVMAHHSAAGDQRLVAYVVTRYDACSADSLRGALSQALPDYMVPACFILLAALPQTPNGKVDRKALPAPDTVDMQREYAAPRTELERVLCALCQDILGLARVGLTDNFFALGGHSLSATRLVARINQAFDVALPLHALFEAGSVGELAQRVLQLAPGQGRPALTPVPRSGELVPSYAQQRLWLLDRIDGGSAHYNMPGALKLDGTLDHAALNAAFTSIVARHESLRTCFAAGDDGRPVQVIEPARPVVVPCTDLSAYARGEQQAQLAQQAAEEAGVGFDLARDLMLRAHLFKLAADEHVLLVTMHHIASDGWSMAILIDEFCALYRAHVQGEANPLPPLAIQYADYAHWQRNWLQGDVLEQQLDYWTGQLAGLPVVHGLPLDRARPTLQSFNGDTLGTRIDAPACAALAALCQACGATLFMGVHAAFSVLLARYSNETDIMVGSPIANREQAEVAGLIGFFVNTLVLRSDLSGNPGFGTLLERSKRMLLGAYAHQQVPFEQIVERLQPQRSMSHSPLFQVMLVLQNNEQGALALPGLTLSAVDHGRGVAKYDLTLHVGQDSDGLRLGWEYNSDLFDASTIARMARHFETLLKALLQAPAAGVFDADMLDADERFQLLAGWNDTARAYPDQSCIHQLFEQQAAACPDAVAIECAALRMTYGQLNAKANQLAHYLASVRKVGPDCLVGICMERSPEMVVGMLAILKAGGAYVPMDPAYPPARLARMLDDARLDTVLTLTGVRASLAAADDRVLCLDAGQLPGQLAAQPETDIAPSASGPTARHLAYVIYTSGSSGQPKGVMIEHRNVVRLVRDNPFAPLGKDDCVAHCASPAFDAATWEIWGALLNGARLLVLPPALVLDAPALCGALVGGGVTAMWLTVGLFNEYVDALAGAFGRLRYLLVGGDALDPATVARALNRKERPGCLLNGYGPTESTTFATTCIIEAVEEGAASVPIGLPIANTQVYLLDERMQPVPVGVTGEIHIGGDGLGRGYLHQPELTAQRFVTDPFSARPGARLYKTGDLGRRLPDGRIDYAGRNDNQVKLRGYRIELGEIEAKLRACHGVRDAVVVVREEQPGDKRLCAYLTAIDAVVPTAAALRAELTASLASYMLPAAFMVVDAFALTHNGKVDRKALPAPDQSQLQAQYVAPRTLTEMLLCEVWGDVLGLERVGATDNFFMIGGHSLLAIKLLTEMKKRFDIDLAIKTMFQFPDLQGMAAYLEVMNPIVTAAGADADAGNPTEGMETFQL